MDKVGREEAREEDNTPCSKLNRRTQKDKRRNAANWQQRTNRERGTLTGERGGKTEREQAEANKSGDEKREDRKSAALEAQ